MLLEQALVGARSALVCIQFDRLMVLEFLKPKFPYL
jgi:hypothetical protein